MKTVLITGSSGMVGGLVLNECLENSDIKKVISFVRRPSELKHKKLQEIILRDFTDYSNLTENFESIDVAYFCIGVYTGAVSRDEFRKITVDYTMAFTDALKAGSPNARICFLSGQGADPREKSRMMFARYKGAAENYLMEIFDQAIIFRPAYIYPVQKRNEPNFSYRLSRRLYPLIKLFGENMSIRSTDLAHAIFRAGMEGSPKKVLENRDIHLFLRGKS